MGKSTSFWIGLAIGAAASAALALFIQSDAGQEVIDEIKDATDKAQDELKKTYSAIQDKLDKSLSKGRDMYDDLEKKASKAKQSAS